MSFFKHAQDTIKSSYSTRQDALSSSSTPKNAFMYDLNTKYEKNQSKAQEMIQRIPASGQGYLLSVLIYQEQNNLPAAIKVCLQGLESISPEKYPQHYTQLLKEKEKMLEKQAKCSQNGFFHLLPYPIICMIFDIVGYRDLLPCINVCRQWFDFIMVEYPRFWNKLMPRELPREHRSNIDALMRHETREYRLTAGDPEDSEMLQNIFVLLPMLRNSHSVQKLYFSYPKHWYAGDIQALGPVIRCLSQSLKELEIICCKMDDTQIFTFITDVCSSSLTYISISLTKRQYDAECDYLGNCHETYEKRVTLKWIPFETKQQRRISAAPLTTSVRYFPAVTYLKSDNYLANMSEQPRQSMFNLSASLNAFDLIRAKQTLRFNQFPNLVHLFIGWHETSNHYYRPFYQETIKSCPRLENLIVTFSGTMPHTIISDIDQTELDNSTIKALTPSTTKKRKTGLRRFALTDCNMSQEEKNVLPIFKKHHATLELLYLDYDNMGMGPVALSKLASLGCPNLREFRLSSVSRMLRKNKPIKGIAKTSEQVLVQLFSACPELQVVELNQEIPIYNELFYEINATIVETIAQKCPQLTYFSFNSDYPTIHMGHGGCSGKNFLCFIKNNYTTAIEKGQDDECVDEKQQDLNINSRLECLKIPEMDPATALTLVQNLASLKHLRIFKWYYYNPNPASNSKDIVPVDSSEKMLPVKQILESRGGSLVLD